MAKLIVMLSDGRQTTHELTDEIVTLGRHTDNTIVIDDVSTSNNHARLTRAGDGYQLEDVSSTGTTINGEAVKEARLRDGDRIAFGRVEAVYEADPVPALRLASSPEPPVATPPPTPEAMSLSPAGSPPAIPPFPAADWTASKRCKNHPDVEAVDRCAGCAEAFCPNCLVEIHGQKYCGACKVMAIKGQPVAEEATIPCKEAGEALKYAIIGIFCFGIILEPIAISKALKAKKMIDLRSAPKVTVTRA
jgi:FHA domain-containing protein